MKRKIATFAVLLLPAIMAGMTAAHGAGVGNAEKGQATAANCKACHGNDGNSTASATTPKLAEQIPQYVVKQLHDFKSGARQNPIMGSMAATLSDQDMLDVAAFFSQQKMAPDGIKDKRLAGEGEKIFKGGLADKAVPACSSCHGANGGGMPPTFPRLAGQHPQYLIAQLKNFQSGQRANDPNKVMRDIASKLTEHQIEAVAEYLGGL